MFTQNSQRVGTTSEQTLHQHVLTKHSKETKELLNVRHTKQLLLYLQSKLKEYSNLYEITTQTNHRKLKEYSNLYEITTQTNHRNYMA
jgi:hypothetical protein